MIEGQRIVTIREQPEGRAAKVCAWPCASSSQIETLESGEQSILANARLSLAQYVVLSSLRCMTSAEPLI